MVLMGLGAGLSGCVLAPPGASEEQAKLDLASAAFEAPIDKRQVAALPAPAEWRDVLSRSFLVNGELEAAYFDWKAALTRIDQAATWPNSNTALSYSYMFSSENLKSWDRTTIGVGFDPSMNLSLPVKTYAAGKVALEAAREASERFRTAKFGLQQRVLTAYLDLALAEEKRRIARENVSLLRLMAESAANRVQAGGPLQDLLKAQTETQLAENELGNLEADINSMRGMLNGMLGRDPNAALTLPPALPAPRPVAVDDARLIAVALDQNPELAGLARQVAGRKDAVELARLAYLPDLIPSASITGSISQVVGAMLMMPTTVPKIRAAITEAQAMTRESEAMLRQARQDRAATFVGNLYLMRNAERQLDIYRQRLVPAVDQLVSSSRQAYAAGTIGFADLIDSQRTFISVRSMVAEAQIEREKRLAQLEALAGVDIEMLGAAAPPQSSESPSAGPTQQAGDTTRR